MGEPCRLAHTLYSFGVTLRIETEPPSVTLEEMIMQALQTGRHRSKTMGWIGLLVILIPVIAACGTTAPAAPTAAVPTAAIATQAPPTTIAELPTTVAELPTTVTEQPTVQPGPADTTFPLKTPYLEFGVVTHLYYTDRERVLQLTQNAGFDWVRQQVVWKDIEDPDKGIYAWDQLDAIVAAVNAYGRKLLVNVVQSPTRYNATNGLPDDPKALGNFVEQMALRYGNKIAAYEIWNEPNLAHENGGRIVPEDVGHYVEILMECYKRIKAVTPEAYVLAAASSSTGVTNPDIALSDEDFYRAMYTYRDGIIDGFFDVQAVHPGGSNNPPDTLWPDNPGPGTGCPQGQCWQTHPTFYFRHVENVRRWMEEYGFGDHQIWITEYGWATQNNSPGYEFGNDVSYDQQAAYITGAIRRAYEQYPWMGNMFLWNMNFAVTKAENGLDVFHEQASFGILNPDWSPRPSYLAVQSLIAELKAKQDR